MNLPEIVKRAQHILNKLFHAVKSVIMAKIKTTYIFYSTSVSETGILEKKNECTYQESNLRPSDY